MAKEVPRSTLTSPKSMARGAHVMHVQGCLLRAQLPPVVPTPRCPSPPAQLSMLSHPTTAGTLPCVLIVRVRIDHFIVKAGAVMERSGEDLGQWPQNMHNTGFKRTDRHHMLSGQSVVCNALPSKGKSKRDILQPSPTSTLQHLAQSIDRKTECW